MNWSNNNNNNNNNFTVYVNGEGRVVLIYPVNIYPPTVDRNIKGRIQSFLLVNNAIKVDDVATTTHRKKC